LVLDIMSWLINAAQADKFRKNQRNVVILDATWHLPGGEPDAKAAFLKQHILGARFLNLDDFYDATSPFPSTLIQDEAKIAAQLGALGITHEHKVIFYDQSPLHTSCRALWMFKVFGHDPNQLYILDGGLTGWQQYCGALEENEPRPATPKSYKVRLRPELITRLSQVKLNLQQPVAQVIDTRHPVRFAGGSEARSHLRGGHIPGSISFPYFTMFESDGRFKPLDKIRKQLFEVGVNLHYPIIVTCGSGTSAATLDFVLDLMEHKQHTLYDGAWAEWGSATLYPGESSLEERPVETCLLERD
jgi:thiosulfate/3-mercaptopyruvate sulfurtransferase